MGVRYVSTRGGAPELGFGDVLLAGLASDGGLYVPDAWPHLGDGFDGKRPYADVAVDVMWPYVEGSIERADFEGLVADAYATFEHPDVCPVVEVDGLHLLELFWGPTLAFKDVALQLVGRLFDHELTARGRRASSRSMSRPRSWRATSLKASVGPWNSSSRWSPASSRGRTGQTSGSEKVA